MDTISLILKRPKRKKANRAAKRRLVAMDRRKGLRVTRLIWELTTTYRTKRQERSSQAKRTKKSQLLPEESPLKRRIQPLIRHQAAQLLKKRKDNQNQLIPKAQEMNRLQQAQNNHMRNKVRAKRPQRPRRNRSVARQAEKNSQLRHRR